MPLTAPQEAAVVIAANRAVAAMPKRVSLPSMLPPLCKALATWSAPSALNLGLPDCSAHMMATTALTKITVIAANKAQPWRLSPTIWPNARHKPAGIKKIASICSEFVQALGFSNGCAELAFKNPPPLVPTILMASCEAIGPMGKVCVAATLATSVGLPSAPAGPGTE